MTNPTEPAIISIHSFTPVYKGERRKFDIGILHDADSRLADELLTSIGLEGKLTCLRNLPYGPDDGVLHTLGEHAAPRGLLNAMIEIRNDLLADSIAQLAMAKCLARHIRAAMAVFNVGLKNQVSAR